MELNNDSEDISRNIKNKFEQYKLDIETIGKLTKESYPDFTKFRVKYDENVKAFIQELETDPSISPIINGM